MKTLSLCFVFALFSLALRAQQADTVIHGVNVEEVLQEAQDADSYDDGAEDEVTYENDDEENYDYTSETPSHTPMDPADLQNTKSYTTEKLEVKKFDEARWKEIVGTTDYNEKKEEQKKKKENKEGEEEGEASGSVPWNSDGLRLIAYIIIVGIVLTVLYVLARNMSGSINIKRKEKIAQPDLSAPVENIEELDVTSLLQQTLAAGNFRLALRMYFLGLLKDLHTQGMIAWKKDKTNRDYLGEVFSKNFYFDEIRKLTLAYEQVWYGEYTLSRESYQSLFSEFERIQQNLNASKTS